MACLASSQAAPAQDALISSIPPQPLPSTEALTTQEQQKLAFEKYGISETQDAKSMVGGHYYNNTAIWDYYVSSGDQESSALELKAQADHKFMVPFFTISTALGLASLGGLGLYAAFKTPVDYSHDGSGQQQFNLAIGGILGGIFLGTVVGAIGAYQYHRKATSERHEAADGFNARLLKKLQLSVLPQPGGAKTGVDVKF